MDPLVNNLSDQLGPKSRGRVVAGSKTAHDPYSEARIGCATFITFVWIDEKSY